MTSQGEGRSVRPRGCEEVRKDVMPMEEGPQEVIVESLGDELDFKEESDEALVPNIARDPGAPTAKEMQDHAVTHLPHRSWCPVCVESRSRDRPHRLVADRSERGVPEVHFDYGFLGNRDEEETQAIQVARDVRSQMLFAHHVPRKGMASEHGAEELIKDLSRLGHAKVILKSDQEPALVAIQKEVARRREKETILENSPKGDSKANGVAERAVQAFAEQFRVVRAALQQRLGAKIPGNHCLTSWMTEHAADLLNKYHVGVDGRTAYRRWKGKDYRGEQVELGEKVHHRTNVKGANQVNKMDARWSEGYYIGTDWRTGEALIGTAGGVVKASAIRRVGSHRRWDAEGLLNIRGTPWRRIPLPEDEDVAVTLVPLPAEPEIGARGAVEEESAPRRIMLRRADFYKHGFTDGCRACKVILSGKVPERGGNKLHSEACRTRMEELLKETQDGEVKLKRYRDRVEEEMAKRVEKLIKEQDAEEQDAKKARTRASSEALGHSTSVGVKPSSVQGGVQGAGPSGGQKRPVDDERAGGGQAEKEAPEPKVRVLDGDDLDDMFGPDWSTLVKDTEMDTNHVEMQKALIELNIIERTMAEDFRWPTIDAVDDLCEPKDIQLQQQETAYEYWDEVTGQLLDPRLVAKAEMEELDRFKQMGVYTYVSREQALNDSEGVFVKTKWVRVNKGVTDPRVRCRLVAQELAFGERMDELFAGTPSLSSMRMALAHASSRTCKRKLMVLDVKCAFLYAKTTRNIYIELPSRDPRSGGAVVGQLQRALYGTRDAPQLWGEEVRRVMLLLGFRPSALQPSVYVHDEKQMMVVVHVDDFLVSGIEGDLVWFANQLKQHFDLKESIIGRDQGDKHEERYLNRILRWTTDNFLSVEGDPKHAEILLKEWGFSESKATKVPTTKEIVEGLGAGDEVMGAEQTKMRRAIARINYMAQDRPDLSYTARELSRHMATPREGLRRGLDQVLRYLRGQPRCVQTWKASIPEEGYQLKVFSDSDWANDKDTRKSVSGGFVMLGPVVMTHWSKTQTTVALSSAEAEFNGVVKGLIEGVSIFNLAEELWRQALHFIMNTDASACKGMLLRTGVGKLKHLSTKQLWAQGAVAAFRVQVTKVPRSINSADAFTHPLGQQALQDHLRRVGYRFP